MRSFELSLKNEKIRFYSRFSVLLICILAILYTYIFIADFQPSTISILISTLVGGTIVFSLFRPFRFSYPLCFVFLALAFATMHYYIPAACSLIFALLVFISLRSTIVTVDENQVIWPSFPKKLFSWAELSNVILKDGLLTIDLKDNKLIQQPLEMEASIDEKDFNEFCQRQLHQNHKR
jgi:hypothetical protein